MSWLSGVRKTIGRWAAKAAGHDLSLLPRWTRWLPLMPEFQDLVTEAYKGNATVFACQLILALHFPEPELWPWEVEPVTTDYVRRLNHPLRRLLSKPNPDMGEAELWKYVITYCPLGGNVYLWKQRDAGQRVMALWPFHDGHMTPVPGRTTAEGLVAYYVLNTGDGYQHNPFGVARDDSLPGMAIPKGDIIHWKWMVDPDAPHRGIGALTAAAGDAELANEIRRFVYSLLKNDATPPIVITLVEGDELTPEKADRLRREWAQRMGGSNRGKPAFLEAGMTIQQMAYNLQQLSIEGMRDGPDAAICMGYHIHPSVVGALVGLKYSTYSNQAEARKALVENTLIPLWRSFASEIQQGMADEVGYNRELRVAFDLNHVRALAVNTEALEGRLRAGLDAGAITRAEYRRALGYQVTESDNVFKETLQFFWVPPGKVRGIPALAAGGGAPVAPQEPPTGSNSDVPPENIESTQGLNGAQIRAALDIVAGLSNGEISPTVALELLTALGIDRERAESIVNASKSFLKAGRANKRRAELRERLTPFIVAMRTLRDEVQGRMETELAAYFVALGEDIDARLTEKARKGLDDPAPGAGYEDTLITSADEQKLVTLFKRFYLSIISNSWDVINLAIDSSVDLDETNPAVTRILGQAGEKVQGILETTKAVLREALAYGAEQGWSIRDLIKGDASQPGVLEIVEQAYEGRAENVARTELGMAQNAAANERYRQAGVQHVMVFDNGFANSHEFCRIVDGQVVTVEWMQRNPLQHPRCVRVFGAVFDYDGEVFTDELGFGEHL